jgi:fucose permease
VGSALGAAAAGLQVAPLGQFIAVTAIVLLLVGTGTRKLLGVEADRQDGSAVPSGPGERTRLRDHRVLIAIGIVAFCGLFAEGAVENWSGVFLHQVRHASYGVAPLGVAASGTGMAIGRFLGDTFIARWGRTRVLVVSSTTAAIGVTSTLVGGSVASSLAGYALFGFGIATLVPIAFTLAGNSARVPPAWAISRVSTMGYVGQLASPAVIGLSAQGIGLTAALALPIALLALVIPIALTLRPT